MLRIVTIGPDLNGSDIEMPTDITVPLGREGPGAGRLENVGLLLVEDGTTRFEESLPGSPFESLSRTSDFYADVPAEIACIALPRDRMPREVFYLPALLAIVFVVTIQGRRADAAPSRRNPAVNLASEGHADPRLRERVVPQLPVEVVRPTGRGLSNEPGRFGARL